MRNLVMSAAFAAVLFSPLALAQALIKVEPNSMMRLPGNTSVLLLERLEVADHGTLLVPASLSDIRVASIYLGPNARIAIAPSERSLRLEVAGGEIASGAQITARGAPGTFERPAVAGRTLVVRLENVTTESLLIDVRGGKGTPGYAGLMGATGKTGGCLWGQSSKGLDGYDGGDGHEGAAGGHLRVEVPQAFPTERLTFQVEGGEGGMAGAAGAGGAGGASKGCWIYSTSGARDGRPGQAGQAGAAGVAGSADIITF
ncbi:collagen-like protein [Pseudomonas sp. NPDC078700]|uniref:collagen-like protein n=1 Tax=Pseudomonas sp. NPDC078700 TaxID=3364424 RepID=UPI0037C6255D